MLTLLAILFAIVCILLVVAVMIQSGKSGSMGLFGGGGTSSIGSQSGDIMTRITTILGIIFFILTLSFAFLVSRDTTASRLDKLQTEESRGMLAPGEKEDEVLPPVGAAEGLPETGIPQF
ncbi:MAG: preprotein translocase subunit SecG [Spirochaetota bacterium]|jgi:preprotein translocase subunit SecG|nr:preprotein translocase subunit SecG [Spirochaetota bacterium]